MAKQLDQVTKFDDEAVEAIKSFDDAMALFAEAGIEVTDISDYGDGFGVVDKDELINQKFVIFDYKFGEGEYGGDGFAIVRVVTADGRKCIITDGGTGICAQTRSFARRGKTGGIVVPRGLTVSEYKYKDENGKETPAKTYYFGM